MDVYDITLKQIKDMMHCIGFNRKLIIRGKYEAYRNFYCTNKKVEKWDLLVDIHLAIRTAADEEFNTIKYFYSLTDKGINVLENLFKCKITEGK